MNVQKNIHLTLAIFAGPLALPVQSKLLPWRGALSPNQNGGSVEKLTAKRLGMLDPTSCSGWWFAFPVGKYFNNNKFKTSSQTIENKTCLEHFWTTSQFVDVDSEDLAESNHKDVWSVGRLLPGFLRQQIRKLWRDVCMKGFHGFSMTWHLALRNAILCPIHRQNGTPSQTPQIVNPIAEREWSWKRGPLAVNMLKNMRFSSFFMLEMSSHDFEVWDVQLGPTLPNRYDSCETLVTSCVCSISIHIERGGKKSGSFLQAMQSTAEPRLGSAREQFQGRNLCNFNGTV